MMPQALMNLWSERPRPLLVVNTQGRKKLWSWMLYRATPYRWLCVEGADHSQQSSELSQQHAPLSLPS